MLVLHNKPKYQRKYRVEHLAYSPDGRRLAAAVYRRAREGWQRQKEGRLLTWDLARGGDAELKLEEERLAGLAWTPDGQHLTAVTLFGRVYVWAARDRGFAASHHDVEPPRSATCLAPAPDNQTALVAHGDPYRWGEGGVRLVHWRPRSSGLSFQTETVLEHVLGGVWSVDVSPADGTVALGMREGVALQSFPDLRERMRLRHRGVIGQVRFSPDGHRLASRGGWRIRVWDANREDHPLNRELRGHAKDVTSIAWSPDGRLLLSGSLDETVRLWDPRTGRQLGCYDWGIGPIRSVAFSPDGTTAAVGGGQRDAIVVWDVDV
jgi:WD40 repeat protein